MRNAPYGCCIRLAIHWGLSGALILCAEVEVALVGLVRSNAASWPFDVGISPTEEEHEKCSPRGSLCW